MWGVGCIRGTVSARYDFSEAKLLFLCNKTASRYVIIKQCSG